VPSEEWERGFAAGYHSAHRTDVRDITSDRGELLKDRDLKANTYRAKRKPSAYNKEYAKQYAILKKKHPRTKFSVLAKKAHAATKKVMK
jgi:hypothetical protein